jgi:phosphatidylglycerol---prolipoprotein diacylglyceryl transferase
MDEVSVRIGLGSIEKKGPGSLLACGGGMVCAARVFATYIHDLNPVLLKITDAIQLRWYGLAYLAGFVAGFLLLRNLARRKLWVLKPEQTGDFIAAAALFGVFLGGRLGYILLYQIPKIGWNGLAADPLMVLRVWEGGMASHGGILGLAIFTWIYARRHKVTWTGLGDGLCVVAPVGLFFGRVANFINGELYGRVTDGVAWAVKFPLSLAAEPQEVQSAAWQACTEVEPALAKVEPLEQLIAVARDNPEVSQVLGNFLPERHPSQIYEALLEGALLFAILWWVRTRFPKAPDGLLTGLFFGLYAIFRIVGEQFREPDAEMVGVLTKGQFLSLFMFLFCAAFLAHAWRGWKNSRAVVTGE